MPERFDIEVICYCIISLVYYVKASQAWLQWIFILLLIRILHKVSRKSIFCSLDHMRWKWCIIPKCLFHCIKRKQTSFCATKGTIFVHFLWKCM